MKRITSIALCLLMAFTLLVSCAEKPLTVDDMLDLGERYLLDMEYEQALAQFLAVVEIEPMNPRGYTGAADAYVGLGDTDNAIAILEKGLEKLQGNAEIQAKMNTITHGTIMKIAACYQKISGCFPEIHGTISNLTVKWLKTSG